MDSEALGVADEDAERVDGPSTAEGEGLGVEEKKAGSSLPHVLGHLDEGAVAETARLGEACRERDRQRDAMEKEKDELRERLAEARAERDTLREALAAARSERDRLKEELALPGAALRVVRSRNADLVERNGELHEQLAEANSTVESLRKGNAYVNTRNEELSIALAAVTEKLAEVKAERRGLREEVEGLKAEGERLRIELRARLPECREVFDQIAGAAVADGDENDKLVRIVELAAGASRGVDVALNGGPGSRVQGPESRVQSPGSRVQSPESRVKTTECTEKKYE